MKVLAVARSLDGSAGGVERSVTFLLNAMAHRGHSTVLFTWDRVDAESFYPQVGAMEWEKLDDGDVMKPAGWIQRLRRMRRIRHMVHSHQPDVVVAYQQGPFMVVALSLLGTGIPVLAAERNAPTRFDYTRAGKWRSVIFLTFLMARRIVVQFDRYRELYPSYLRRRIVTIGNAVPRPYRMNADFACDPVILFVGRLSYQKDPIMLLRAYAILLSEGTSWRLRMVGNGERESEVRQVARELEIENAVEMAGARQDIETEYERAGVFCLPSLWEGFPNAAGEAMAHGVPVVGFRECAGLSDLVRHEREGLLVEERTPEGLAGALRRIIGDDALRQRLGVACRKRAAEFDPDTIARTWESMLTAAGKGQ